MIDPRTAYLQDPKHRRAFLRAAMFLAGLADVSTVQTDRRGLRAMVEMLAASGHGDAHA